MYCVVLLWVVVACTDCGLIVNCCRDFACSSDYVLCFTIVGYIGFIDLVNFRFGWVVCLV